ncbi:hypothetical protein SLEP1_g9805 [Rubroshorea leprosula]|uniref:Uncharacterized protein n=1 Tax=Rubroshorea leprosula TaxID=152421 RepID=A0AAV5IAL0_9ROSI|nr:hypothetical protein SLEP1_g9805 [Rubroshorea leprosula]
MDPQPSPPPTPLGNLEFRICCLLSSLPPAIAWCEFGFPVAPWKPSKFPAGSSLYRQLQLCLLSISGP